MKKCLRCGKKLDDKIMICDECGFNFVEHSRIQKKLGLDKNKNASLDRTNKTDLFDYPILAFIFGILALCLPIYIFSFLALTCSKKPTKESLEACSNVGRVLAYIGFVVSTILVVYIVINLI